jgi:hypothetical protein
MLCIDEPTFLSRVQFSSVGVGGKKLADEALRKQPDLKVLYTTGYTANAVVHGGVLERDAFRSTRFGIPKSGLF